MAVLKKEVLPAIIALDQAGLDEMLDRVKDFAENIMLDLMDGKFVQASSLDFPMKLPEGPRYQFHVMAIDPIQRLMDAPEEVDTIVLHAEALDEIAEAIEAAREKKVKLFIALNPETPTSVLDPYLDRLDGVLIMSVNPGQYGAKFLPEQLEKVRAVRDKSETITIEVDGGMNHKTMGAAVEAGSNQIASGSYIMKSSDPEAAYESLKALF
ncbi:MAG: ribulose-phosphate 3-epimerase [Candidatus Bathyarchaeota archaeon]